MPGDDSWSSVEGIGSPIFTARGRVVWKDREALAALRRGRVVGRRRANIFVDLEVVDEIGLGSDGLVVVWWWLGMMWWMLIIAVVVVEGRR